MMRIDYLQAFLKGYASMIDCKLNCFLTSAREHYIEALNALENAYTSGQITWDTFKGYYTSLANSFYECECYSSLS